ncbi:PKD domain-containing protein [Aquimarina sp. AD10]|uniref:PKD domain-containing protein n=1 Tax=Aquimarina TaxID=290174 RepID=UPI000E4CEB50|nr:MULTISPECIES: PKD domain-containing protein [Aquimarina]AXT58883.1 PKD domain-containing protein [Aquimarina sp. AD10]RKM99641.1 PKD domain-containing protein [Aquimarina sp. AD10]
MRKIVLNYRLISKTPIVTLLVFLMVFISCDFVDELPEANSIADETPPNAFFTFTNGVEIETFTQVTFANQSDNATNYSWDLGDGNTSTEIDPMNTYPGEGSYTVTLTVTDALNQTSTYSETIELIEPDAPAVPDPVLLNAEFNRLPKSSGSDCTCSGWINKSIGDQGESSSGNGSDVIKFDNNEPDHAYQEFAVTPNADYRIEIPIRFQSDQTGDMPSQLEVRVLAGEGYIDGYTPMYFEETALIPQDDFGYTSVAQTEEAANNLLVETLDNVNTSEYRVFTFFFNSGANDSVALFIRGIGGPATGGGGGDFGYNSGDEEIRVDSVTITAVN